MTGVGGGERQAFSLWPWCSCHSLWPYSFGSTSQNVAIRFLINMTNSWIIALLVILQCLMLAFAVLGLFDWFGLVSLDIVPCPCRDHV